MNHKHGSDPSVLCSVKQQFPDRREQRAGKENQVDEAFNRETTWYSLKTELMVMGEDRHMGSWIIRAAAVRWGNAGCRCCQQHSVVIHSSQVVHTVRTPCYISPAAHLHSTPPLSPPSPATHRQEVPRRVLSRQQRSIKPSCAPMGSHSQIALGRAVR